MTRSELNLVSPFETGKAIADSPMHTETLVRHLGDLVRANRAEGRVNPATFTELAAFQFARFERLGLSTDAWIHS